MNEPAWSKGYWGLQHWKIKFASVVSPNKSDLSGNVRLLVPTKLAAFTNLS